MGNSSIHCAIKPFSGLGPEHFEGIAYDDENSTPEILCKGNVIRYPVILNMRVDENHHDVINCYGDYPNPEYIIRAVVNKEAEEVHVEVMAEFDTSGEPIIDICIHDGVWYLT